MKKKYFYSHIVETTEISLAIGDIDMPKKHRVKLISLAEENLHHEILDAVLSKLSEDDKKLFLSHLSLENHDKAWEMLSKKVDKVEELVIKLSNNIKKQMQKDIKSATK